MGFKLIEGMQPPILKERLVTNGEAVVAGQALQFVAGRLTASSGDDPVAAVAFDNVPAGVDQTCKVVIVDGVQTWEVPYEGQPAAGFVIGANAVQIADGSVALDATAVTGGACSVIQINPDNGTAHIRFNNRQIS